MTPAELEKAIEQKNRQTAADRGKQFVKRSSDQQMLNLLAAAARNLLDAQPGTRNFDSARAELRSATVLAERRSK